MDTDTPDPTPTGVESLVGRVLDDRYRIENVVTAGANRVITEAIDTEGNRPVTVKIVRPELAVTSAFRQAFRRQVEVGMSLNHPNIVSVLGGRIDGNYGMTPSTTKVTFLAIAPTRRGAPPL